MHMLVYCYCYYYCPYHLYAEYLHYIPKSKHVSRVSSDLIKKKYF